MTDWDFIAPADQALARAFLAQGYVIVPAEDLTAAQAIQTAAATLAAQFLGLAPPDDASAFLDQIHQQVTPPHLNDLRLFVFQRLNSESWLRAAYFATARRAIEALVGNELAMQIRVNLSIQMPQDDSSLLPIHCDVWNGDSPYEIVLWLPLVDCRASKSMFILPAPADARWQARMPEFLNGPTEALYQAVKPDLHWPDVPFGHVLLFTQNIMHGNRVNHEPTTRWSMNCRFKGLFTPYCDKALGEFFAPITIRAATRLGAGYRLPGASDD